MRARGSAWSDGVDGRESFGVTGLILHPTGETARNESLWLRAEGFGVGSWDLDLATRELVWLATTRSLFGIAGDQPVTYDLFLSLLAAGDRQQTEQAVARAVEGVGDLDLSFHLQGMNGRSQWIRLRAGLVDDARGAPRHLRGIVLDINDAKQTEDELRK